jgi:hypothetical protein
MDAIDLPYDIRDNTEEAQDAACRILTQLEEGEINITVLIGVILDCHYDLDAVTEAVNSDEVQERAGAFR